MNGPLTNGFAGDFLRGALDVAPEGVVISEAKGDRAVVYVNPAGKAADAGEGGTIETTVRQGNIVLAVDPRGWGESAPRPKSAGGYSTPYQTTMRALLVGKNMPGMQTVDVLRHLDRTTHVITEGSSEDAIVQDMAVRLGFLNVHFSPRGGGLGSFRSHGIACGRRITRRHVRV